MKLETQNMKHKSKILLILILVFSFSLLAFRLLRSNEAEAGLLDSFAQCLSDKGAVMYGADWCPHCQNQKKGFGGSFKFINYVECPQDPQKCLAAGIEGYPTWIINGEKLIGEQALETLSEKSRCTLSTKTK